MMAIKVIRYILAFAIEWFCLFGIWYRATDGEYSAGNANLSMIFLVLHMIIFPIRDFAFIGWLAGKE